MLSQWKIINDIKSSVYVNKLILRNFAVMIKRNEGCELAL